MAAFSALSPVRLNRASPTPDDDMATRRLLAVIAANGMLRIAGGASGVLVGVYAADLANHGFPMDARLVGALAAASFGAELLGAIPMGVLADAWAPRVLMTGGALLAALATLLFGLTRDVRMFFVSRVLEGLAAAVSVPALLAHVVDTTAGDSALRARTMTYFELSLLAGLAVGGLLGGQLWQGLGPGAFAALACVYVVAALIVFAAGGGSRTHTRRAALAGFLRSLRIPSLRQLAPIWLCMNVIVGMWLGPTFYFLLTHESTSRQFLAGLFAANPQRVGWVLLGYSLVFGTGLLAWSVILPRTSPSRALRMSLMAMLAVSTILLLVNHAGGVSAVLRWLLVAIAALFVMVESGFTPAALSLVATAVGARAGRGAAMGIYSFLLSLGALVGNLLAGTVGQRAAIDGLIYSTLVLALVALGLLARLEPVHARAGD
jgi:MFS family permease